MRQVIDLATGEHKELPDDPRDAVKVDIPNVTHLQFRKALRHFDHMRDYKTYYETLTDEMQDEWQFNNKVHIKDDRVKHMKDTLLISNNHMKDIFNKAAEF